MSSEPVVLSVTGMACQGCAKTVTRVLTGVAGVTSAKVELEAARATVEGTAPVDALIEAVKGAGFDAARA